MFRSLQDEYLVAQEQFTNVNQILATNPRYNSFNGYNLIGQNERNFLNNFNQSRFISFQNKPRNIYWWKNRQLNTSKKMHECSKSVEAPCDNGVGTNSSPKEKSPMCLINQLARFNKITPSYNLISEEGPAHKKVFQVQLKFGAEEFTATGQSIKKAQHAAAAEALVNTKYPSPPLRNAKHPHPVNKKVNPSLTPTVELNSIAMKASEVAAYKVVGGFKGRKLMENQDLVHIKSGSAAFEVEVSIGSRTFRGEGHSMMNARHDAASKALAVLNAEDLVTKGCGKKLSEKTAAEEFSKDENLQSETTSNDSNKVKLKSEISQIYEIAYRRKFTVNFEVVKESGPPHMKLYITRCTCGDLMVEEGGNSKKTSKKQSAIKMLHELSKLPPLPAHLNEQSNDKSYRKFFSKHKTNKNLKVQKPNPDCAADMNPVSRLIQILQAKKEQEPQFSTTEKGSGRDREFCVQVTVGNQQSSACAKSKKLAKKMASENMLLLLGFSKPCTNTTKTATSNKSPEKKVTFNDVTEVNLVSNDMPNSVNSMSICPIEQLQYLGRSYGFLVQFKDIPKTIESCCRFLSLVTLTTKPPQHSHGEGQTVEESQRAAATNAIKQLTELGLDGFGNNNNFNGIT